MMEWLLGLLQHVWTHWDWNIASIPIVAAVIGWGTNVLALKMTFYPLEFKGIDIRGIKAIGWVLPPLGWQGIIPSKAEKMAAKSVDMITSKLIDVEVQFSQLNPVMVAKEMSPHLRALCRQVIDESFSQEMPIWKLFSDKRKEQIYQQAIAEIPLVVEDVILEVKANINELFDLKTMAVTQLTNNKSLLNEIFLRVGEKEFKFIEYSGAYFGFIFGFMQMLLFIWYPAWWQLPLAGLIVGYLTNDLALRMIFQPVRPIRFWKYALQGLFIKRQKEVAYEYSKIIADNIMTMPNISEAIFKGSNSDKLAEIVKKNVGKSFDRASGFSSALIKLTSGTRTYEQIKTLIGERFAQESPRYVKSIYEYTRQALDIEHTLRTRMAALPPQEFVGFLRPVFQEDELKLIIVGAILGMIAGFFQILLM